MKIGLNFVLIFIILVSMYFLRQVSELENTFNLFQVIIGILSFFTVLIAFLKMKGNKLVGELWSRTLTFWWMTGIFLLTINLDYRVTFIPLCLLGILSTYELNNLFPVKIKSVKLFQLLFLVFTPFIVYFMEYQSILLLCGALCVTGLPILTTIYNQTEDQGKLFFLLSNFILFGVFSYSHFYLLLQLGTSLFVSVLFLTQIRDLISYWIGKFAAKFAMKFPVHSTFYKVLDFKVAEKVSPNKTWFVGIVSTMIIALISFSLLSVYEESTNLKNLSFIHTLNIGVIIGITGLFGDLYFSYLKRISGVKDSGATLPGGEGALDRVDGLMLTIPFVYFYLKYFQLF